MELRLASLFLLEQKYHNLVIVALSAAVRGNKVNLFENFFLFFFFQGELFMINDTTGRIMTAAKLDREKNSSVTFIIIVRRT